MDRSVPLLSVIGYLSPDHGGRAASRETQDDRVMRVMDGRGEALTLEKNGFELVQFRPSVMAALSRDALKKGPTLRQYNAELEELVHKNASPNLELWMGGEG